MTTVFRLPEEPPVGTTVRPEPDTGERYVRVDKSEAPAGVCHWRIVEGGPTYPGWVSGHFVWETLFGRHRRGLAIVEPDPHPTPWRASEWGDVYDATGSPIFTVDGDAPTRTAERIVKAVNEATP